MITQNSQLLVTSAVTNVSVTRCPATAASIAASASRTAVGRQDRSRDRKSDAGDHHEVSAERRKPRTGSNREIDVMGTLDSEEAKSRARERQGSPPNIAGRVRETFPARAEQGWSNAIELAMIQRSRCR